VAWRKRELWKILRNLLGRVCKAGPKACRTARDGNTDPSNMKPVDSFIPLKPAARISRGAAGKFYRRARMIIAMPATKHRNMAPSNFEVMGGAARNSLQMKTPQSAATMVAPWPSP
jgi:hypothetical protein